MLRVGLRFRLRVGLLLDLGVAPRLDLGVGPAIGLGIGSGVVVAVDRPVMIVAVAVHAGDAEQYAQHAIGFLGGQRNGAGLRSTGTRRVILAERLAPEFVDH